MDRKQRELLLSIYKKNQFAFWNFLGLKTGARFFFLVVLVPGFIHFPYQNMIFFWASNWCSFFWWSWFLASSIYQDDATVSGDARSTLRTAQSVCCSLRCFQLTILLFSKPSLFQLHLIVFSITRFFFGSRVGLEIG